MKAKDYLSTVIPLVAGNVLFAQALEVDTNQSSIEWHGKKIGGKHDGHIQLKNGAFELEDEQIVSGNFVVDMTSITNSDLKDEGSRGKLVNHLKSDDFFGVETYPTASFEVFQSTEFIDGKATLTGDITIKGKTERITFEVERAGNEFTAGLQIDRSKFDVRYGSKSFFNDLGNRAIDNVFTLNIKLVVKESSAASP